MTTFHSSTEPISNCPEGTGYYFPSFTDVVTAAGVILFVFCALVFWRPSRRAV